MPRASWKGFLRLSLVSCPVYLSPASTRTKSIRLHQVWQPKAMLPAPVEEDEEDEQFDRQEASAPDDVSARTPDLIRGKADAGGGAEPAVSRF